MSETGKRAENCVDYIEIPVVDLKQARDFFGALFGWSFEEWGDDYMSFNDGRLDGGFRRSAEPASDMARMVSRGNWWPAVTPVPSASGT